MSLDLLAVEVTSWKPHLATSVEVCIREAGLGRRVGFAFLDIDNVDEWAALKRPPLDRWDYAALRRSRAELVNHFQGILRSHGVIALTVSAEAFPIRVASADIGIDSTESLHNYRWGGVNLGIGVLSSLVTIAGDSDPEISSHRGVVDRLLTSAAQSFELSTRLFEQYDPRRVLIFNGRFGTAKGISEAARLRGIEVIFHEMWSTPDRYYISNRPPHSVEHSREILRENWNHAGPDREEIGAKFFSPRRGGVTLLSAKFLDSQIAGYSVGPTGRRRIVYYASSIDEFTSVEDGVENTVFETQRDAVLWLCSWVRDRSDTELFIRLHPRIRVMSERELRWWHSLGSANVTILTAHSPVDSYELARTSDRVVCFHSSMGVEATYLGKVSILVGDADYRGLDCVYEPRSLDELESMLTDECLTPKPARNCLPYGFDRMTRGEKYVHYQPKSFHEGDFIGEEQFRLSLRTFGFAKALGLTNRIMEYTRNLHGHRGRS